MEELGIVGRKVGGGEELKEKKGGENRRREKKQIGERKESGAGEG
jgi:hypothetical protein